MAQWPSWRIATALIAGRDTIELNGIAPANFSPTFVL
jgi:hypothetical protein